MKTIKNILDAEIAETAASRFRQDTRVRRINTVLEKIFPLNRQAGEIRTQAWSDNTLSVKLYANPIYGLAHSVDEEEAQAWLRDLLSVSTVKTWEKGFNPECNQITYKATVDGVLVEIVTDTPSTCTVERYEVEEIVEAEPAQSEYTRFVTRYRLKGDCPPVMAGESSGG